MSEIVFDLEWNMGYPKPGDAHFDEIIEIGAAKVENGQVVGTYKEYIRPTFHKTIHHHVRKILPFTKKDLKDARPFTEVIREFKEWCGPNPRLVSWGNSDISVLQANLARFGMAPDWVGEVYDLQAGYAYLLGEYTRQYALKDAVAQLNIEAPEEFHDAANDAYYTALVGVAILEKFGALPDSAVILAKREELRAIRAEELRVKAKIMETAALADAPRLAELVLSPAPTQEAALSTREASSWVCPQCSRTLRATGWSVYAEQGWLTRGRCDEHGWFYAYTTFEQGADGWKGLRVIFPATQKLKSTYFRFGHNKAK